MSKKRQFEMDAEALAMAPRLLITVTRLPSGALEVQQNTEHLQDKIDYIIDKYDGSFRLKANSEVQIVDYILL